ncbi:Zn-dependent exopeptidase M28 [bacterium]|nr:Zn-dependent exopeptidase M28 [candidate division CSSED10-310 bacterium]
MAARFCLLFAALLFMRFSVAADTWVYRAVDIAGSGPGELRLGDCVMRATASPGIEPAAVWNLAIDDLVLLRSRTGAATPPPPGMLLDTGAGWIVPATATGTACLTGPEHWQALPLHAGITLCSDGAPHHASLPDVAAIVGAVDTAEIMTRIDELVAFDTRYARSADFHQVSLFLQDTLAQYGYAAELQGFEIPGSYYVENVIAVLPGQVEPEQQIIICGHYDSISQDPYNLAPGADDNGSGAAGVLEAARVMAGEPFSHTIVFALFAAEELGLLGSQHYVEVAQAQGDQISDVINMDMIGYAPPPDGYVMLLESSAIGIGLMDELETGADMYTGLGITRSLHPFGSDHVPFLNVGIPAVLVIENEWAANPNYHRTTDLPDYLDPAFITDGVRMTVAAAAARAEWLGGGTPTPAPTPACTPTPVVVHELPELTMQLNGHSFRAGDQYTLDTVITNNAPVTFIVDRFVALEVYGTFYFHPEWTPVLQSMPVTLPPYGELVETVLSLVMPDPLPCGGPFYAWGVITGPGTTLPLGAPDVVEFILL